VSHPVGVIARFAPLPEKHSDLRALLEGMVSPTRSEPGCLSYDDQAALEHHRTTEHYLNYRAQLSPLLAGPISVTVLAPLDEA
jgi:quinol monooxygenase YgiN